MTAVLPELQAAVAAGFTRWEHFRRARRTNLFPKPVRELPGVGPVWTQQQIDQWFRIAQPAAKNDGEEEALRRVHEKAALRRQPKDGGG